MTSVLRVSFWVGCLTIAGCGGTSSPPPAEPAPGSPTASTPAAPAARASMTAKECEAKGGSVVGDIGDGRTQRPDYVCPNGQAPRGSIVAEPGGPINIEGAVCC